jgi:hypothetical protein
MMMPPMELMPQQSDQFETLKSSAVDAIRSLIKKSQHVPVARAAVAYEALDFHALYVRVPDAMAACGVCIVKGLERNSPIEIAVLIAMANLLQGT